MTDEELVRFCRAGDSAACNVLFEKYKPLVKSRAANKYLSGGEYDDLIQEGMIGLLAAVNDYDPVKAEGADRGGSRKDGAGSGGAEGEACDDPRLPLPS